jgi:hypothetical protein
MVESRCAERASWQGVGGSLGVKRGKGLKGQPLTAARLREQLGWLGGAPFKLGGLVNEVQGAVMLPQRELNRLRLAARPVAEKLRMLDALRERAVSLRRAAARPASHPRLTRSLPPTAAGR